MKRFIRDKIINLKHKYITSRAYEYIMRITKYIKHTYALVGRPHHKRIK